ncbi:MAG: ABC transporter ATP-binding protein [Clostridia bacterium]|nr:ABC transporter ATP-binding protein [Clostridia bacterium]
MKLEVEKLSFSYGAHEVLKELSFEAQAGELIAVLGANGAGKSTLFRCILGLLKRHGGKISIDGNDIRKLSARELSKRLAYIPQSHYPAFNYSVLDMVLMGTAPSISALGSPRETQRRQAYEALRLLNIEKLAERSYLKLSGGEQQLALIARALAQNAKVLLMDEPVANLDFGNQHRVLATAQSLAKGGYTVLLSTHNPQHALQYATRLLAIKDGSLLAEGAPKSALNSGLLWELYGIRAEINNGAVIIGQ